MCVCACPVYPCAFCFSKLQTSLNMKKNLNLTVFEHQDSLLMFGYLQHGFGMLEVTRVAYTVATPNDGGLTIPTLRHRQDRFFLEPVVFLGGKMCFFELNIGS